MKIVICVVHLQFLLIWTFLIARFVAKPEVIEMECPYNRRGLLSMYIACIVFLFQAKRLSTNDLAAIKVIKLEPGEIYC